MQNRIDRLEGLVLSLMTNGPQAAGPAAAAAAINSSNVPASVSGSSENARQEVENTEMIQEEDEEVNGEDSEVDTVTKSMGVMKVDGQGKAFFASEAHWYAILGEVSRSTPLTCLINSSLTHFETDCGGKKLLRRAQKAVRGASSPGQGAKSRRRESWHRIPLQIIQQAQSK